MHHSVTINHASVKYPVPLPLMLLQQYWTQANTFTKVCSDDFSLYLLQCIKTQNHKLKKKRKKHKSGTRVTLPRVIEVIARPMHNMPACLKSAV